MYIMIQPVPKCFSIPISKPVELNAIKQSKTKTLELVNKYFIDFL